MSRIPPLSATEASSQTGIPKRTLLWAIRNGHLDAHKLSGPTGAYLIYQCDLDEYVLRHRCQLDERIAKRQRELAARKRGLDEYIAKRQQQERAS